MQWIEDIPGVHICQFTLPDSLERKFLTIPKRKSACVFEILFCLGGQVITKQPNAAPHKIEKHQILVLTSPSALHAVKISENLQGVLVAIDSQPRPEGVLSACASLGLRVDLCQLKSNMDARRGYTILCNSCWTQAVFDFLTYLPAEERARYCLLKAMELLYILATKDYGMGYPENERVVQIVLDARMYLETHLSEKVTISSLSRMLSVSPTYLKAAFRRIYGISIHHCLMDLRMQRAGELIRCTDRAIYQIAQEVGYEGMSQFSTVFKKHYGVTPGQFKKMSKTGIDCPFR